MPTSAPSLVHEFADADFGDARLTKRLAFAARAFEDAPSASFPEAFGNDSALEGWYRFLDNDRVTPEATLASHVGSTVDRAALYDRIVIAHDTTECRFSGEVRRAG